jgi:chromate transporter
MQNKKEVKNKYLNLFLSTFKLSAFTFGGGFVIVPLMKKRFVDELGWIDEQEMLDLIAISQSSPGPIAVNASILVGYRVAGVPGALVTVFGTVLPPLIIISIVSLFYQAFRDNPLVSIAMKGLLCGVTAVIFDVVIKLASQVLKKKRLLYAAIMLLSFAAVRFLGINIVIVILLCIAAGAADTLLKKKASGEDKK